MSTLLPKDTNNVPLPALRLRNDCAHTISVSATSTRNTSAFDSQTRIVSLYATGPVYLRFGDSSVSATTSDHYFPEGVYYDVSIGGDKTAQFSHVAVLAASYDCQFYISEKH